MSKDDPLILPKWGRSVDPQEQALRAAFPHEYVAFRRIVNKCRGEKADISTEWLDFKSFIRDVGTKPSAFHALTLIDKNLRRYEKGNVEWSTGWRGSKPVKKMTQDENTKSYENSRRKMEDGRSVGNLDRLPLTQSWRYPGPRPEAEFLVKFNGWKSKLGPDHQHLRFPDVYYVFSTIKALTVLSSALLIIKNHPDDANSEKELILQRRYNILCRNINSAIASIARRDSELADRLKIGPGPEGVAAVSEYIKSIL